MHTYAAYQHDTTTFGCLVLQNVCMHSCVWSMHHHKTANTAANDKVPTLLAAVCSEHVALAPSTMTGLCPSLVYTSFQVLQVCYTVPGHQCHSVVRDVVFGDTGPIGGWLKQA